MKPSRMIEGLIVDNFAGGGGASDGIAAAFGRPVVDIGMRMLNPRELARAQGFNDNYILDPVCDRVLPSGKKKRSRLPIASQIRMIGNSVNRDVAKALVAANCNEPAEEHEQAAA